MSEEPRHRYKPFSTEWFLHHNFLPFLFTGLLALIGIISYFENINTKSEVANVNLANMDKQEQNYERVLNLLNNQLDEKISQYQMIQQCQKVLSSSDSAHRK